jgi:sugar/nucleoside kinase (ribokinase family)
VTPSAEAEPAPLVLVVGDVIDDLIVRPLGPTAYGTDTPASIDAVPGGSGANQAVWLAEGGARVRFVGRVGAPDLERHAQVFRDAGVEPVLLLDDELPTGRIVILVDPSGERTMYTDRGANRGLRVGDLSDAVLDGVAALHLSGYALFDAGPRAAVLDLMARANARGLPVSIDPSSTGFLTEVGPAAFLEWVTDAEVLFPNLDEARLLTGATDAAIAAERLLESVPVVAITMGADGALVATRRDGATRVAAVPVTEVIDTTGAGDAFCGAFLASWLVDREVVAAAELGVAAGGRAVTVSGARPPLSRSSRGRTHRTS